jgi:protein SCO1/2
MVACNDVPEKNGSAAQEDNQTLPYIGEHDVQFRKLPSGEMVTDTDYYQIPKFSFVNENGRRISQNDYAGKPFVADFFFASCKTICPIMNSQMARVQEMLRKENLLQQIGFLSHTVDPKHDTLPALRAYAQRVGADTSVWHFVTGNAEDIYWQAQEGYMLTAFPSDTADGGFFHTDKLTLVDRNRHIRGYYDGTSTKDVDRLYTDIKKLIHESDKSSN